MSKVSAACRCPHSTSDQVDLTNVNLAFLMVGMDLLRPFTIAPGEVKYLIVVIDYVTKQIELEPLSKITPKNVIKFFKKCIMIKFRIPEVVLTDNGTQFIDRNIKKIMNDLSVKHHSTSVEQPQPNRQAESANRVIPKGLKRRLDEAKGSWVEELPHVLWAYRTTPH